MGKNRRTSQGVEDSITQRTAALAELARLHTKNKEAQSTLVQLREEIRELRKHIHASKMVLNSFPKEGEDPIDTERRVRFSELSERQYDFPYGSKERKDIEEEINRRLNHALTLNAFLSYRETGRHKM